MAPLITIGESLHASIPAPQRAMKQLVELGGDAYTKPSEPLDFIVNLIESQADNGADYIAVNVDDFGQSDANLAVELMREYVRLIDKFGKGVPVCVDSSDDNVLIAGLQQWYGGDKEVKQPLINSIKAYTADKMLGLKQQYDFAFIALLMAEHRESPGKADSVDELVSLAQQIFEKAVDEHNFKPQEIFFDSTVFPLAIDMPMEPGTAGYTYRTMETIRRIKTHPRLKEAHCSLGISNCARDLPARRIGICRAYVEKAMEMGLDAAIVNVGHKYGQKPADPALVELVDAYARMDGSADKMARPMQLMADFCQASRG